MLGFRFLVMGCKENTQLLFNRVVTVAVLFHHPLDKWVDFNNNI